MIRGAPGGQHRRQGSAGAEVRRPGGSAAWGGSPTRRTWGARVVSTFGNVGCSERGRLVLHRAGRAAACATVSTGCGRPRASPGVPGADRPWGDRAAVPCRPVTGAGARSHDVPAVRHTPQRSHAWFFLPGPPLAGTDIGTNEAPVRAVTRRTGEDAPELRSVPGCLCRLGHGLRSGPGRARAASSRAPFPAFRARRGNGREPPFRATDSPGGRRRRPGPPE